MTVMDQRARHWAFLLALSATLATGLVSATAVYAIRRVLRQDLIDSAAAQTVIRVAKLRGLAERMAGHARGFLLTADPRSLDRVSSDRQAFFERLERLLRSADADIRARLEEVRTSARGYDEALEAVVALRRRGQDTDTVARVFEDRVRPRKDELDRGLGQLIASEEARLDSLDRSTERAASHLAMITTGAAVGALLVALALAILLARAFHSLRRKQAQLEQTMARLEQANRELDAFAGRIAHDLRTPLTPIVLMANRLKRFDDERVVRAADRIERGAEAANRMLEGLLVFSRLGHREEGARAGAAPVVRAALEDFGERIAAAGITVETDLDEDAIVACGEPLFRQLVGNLVGNAIKFMAGRDERRLSIGLRARGPSCALEVRDTGPGIPAEELGQIFKPFYRVAGARAPGSGLGLAIVRRIVEAHGGSVTARSVVGQGAAFLVVLPAAQITRLGSAERARPSPEPQSAVAD
jgi:signal transduction histidine kinase